MVMVISNKYICTTHVNFSLRNLAHLGGYTKFGIRLGVKPNVNDQENCLLLVSCNSKIKDCSTILVQIIMEI